MKNQYFFLQNMQCPIIYLFESNLFILHLSGKDLYSRKDMNLARFNIDCMLVWCVARTSEITHSAIRWRCACLD